MPLWCGRLIYARIFAALRAYYISTDTIKWNYNIISPEHKLASTMLALGKLSIYCIAVFYYLHTTHPILLFVVLLGVVFFGIVGFLRLLRRLLPVLMMRRGLRIRRLFCFGSL